MHQRNRAEFYLLIATFIWGSTFFIIKLALDGISPAFYITCRFSLAAFIFLVFFFKQIFPMSASSFKRGSILGLMLFVGFVMQTIGLKITSASKSGFITGMLVVFTPLLQILIERKIPKPGNIIGVFFVAVGLYFLTSPEGSSFNAGDLLTLLAAMVYALYIIYLDVFSEEKMEPLIFLQVAVVGIGAGLYALAFEDFVFTSTTTVWVAILYTAIMASCVTTYIQTRYQKYTTPTRAAIIFSLEPVIAAVFSYYMLGERIGLLGVAGGGLIVAGILISEFSDSFTLFSFKKKGT